MTFQLQPIHNPDEILRPGFVHRPYLLISPANPRAVIGRNARTGICDTTVSRKEYVVQLTTVAAVHCAGVGGVDGEADNGDAAATTHVLVVDDVKTAIWVNGMPLAPGMTQELKVNDTICLPDGLYGYRVADAPSRTVLEIETDTTGMLAPPLPPTVTTATIAAAPPPLLADFPSTGVNFWQKPFFSSLQPPPVQRTSPGRKRTAAQAALLLPPIADATIAAEAPTVRAAAGPIKAAILEEFYCALCLDIQVQAMTLVPCGHTFCQSCCCQHATHQECPTCRSAVQTRVPCRIVNNVISNLIADVGNQHFCADDVQRYEQRMKEEQNQKIHQPPVLALPTAKRVHLYHPNGNSEDDAILIE